MKMVVKSLADRVESFGDSVQTEEATKTGLIMPFLQGLGYDIFNPEEVVPEFTADIGKKKGEKVDFAIIENGQPTILIECKKLNSELDPSHATQLRRYFNTVSARFAILTNGRQYMFFTDLDKQNDMDRTPFFVFDVLDHDDSDIKELDKFSKENFDEEEILATANELKYMRAIEERIDAEITEPSDEFIKVLASDAWEGRWSASALEQFRSIIKKSFKHYLSEKVRSQFEKAMRAGEPEDVNEAEDEKESSDGIVTTQEEIDGYNIIRAIVSDVISPERVYMRDRQSYCGILIDNNNRKPLARLHFNTSNFKVGLFDKGSEEKVPINSLSDIFSFSDRLKATAAQYVEENS